MSKKAQHTENTQDTAATFASPFTGERWQGGTFAASWISPPHPSRGFEDPTLPTREDDHA